MKSNFTDSPVNKATASEEVQEFVMSLPAAATRFQGLDNLRTRVSKGVQNERPQRKLAELPRLRDRILVIRNAYNGEQPAVEINTAIQGCA